MIVRGLLASVLVLSAGIGVWAACLPSEPTVVPWQPDGGSNPEVDARVAFCDVGSAFDRGSIHRVFGKNYPGTDKQGVVLSRDERRIYFGLLPNVDASSASNLYVATREDKSAEFGPYHLLEGPDGGFGANVRYPTLSDDERTIVFDILVGGLGTLYFATRDDASAPFGAAQFLAINKDTDRQILAPFLFQTDGGKELWYSRFVQSEPDAALNPATNERSRIVGDLGSPNAFATPESISGLPAKVFPVIVSDDGLEVFYSVVIAGEDTEMYSAFRNPDNGVVGAVEGVDLRRLDELNKNELNGKRINRPGWLSPDRCRLYFTSSRDTISNPRFLDIYVATRTPK